MLFFQNARLLRTATGLFARGYGSLYIGRHLTSRGHIRGLEVGLPFKFVPRDALNGSQLADQHKRDCYSGCSIRNILNLAGVHQSLRWSTCKAYKTLWPIVLIEDGSGSYWNGLNCRLSTASREEPVASYHSFITCNMTDNSISLNDHIYWYWIWDLMTCNETPPPAHIANASRGEAAPEVKAHEPLSSSSFHT